MVLDDNLAAREYTTLREELLGQLKHRVTMGFTIATLTAGLYVFAGQMSDSLAAAFALLLPQVLVAWAYAFLRRNTRLLTRLATYLVVFHELPRGGGWELFSRYPFDHEVMRGSHRRFRWVSASFYTTHGLFLVILLSSSVLLVITQPFLPWGVAGIILPLLIAGYHVGRSRESRSYHALCLEDWHQLKRRLEAGESTDTIFNEIVASFHPGRRDKENQP